MEIFDRIILIGSIICEIVIIILLVKQSFSFLMALLILFGIIGFICLIGLLIERFFQPVPFKIEPILDIKNLDTDFQLFRELNTWANEHNLNFSHGDQMAIIQFYKQSKNQKKSHRMTKGSILMSFIMSVGTFTIATVSLVIAERNFILQNILQL